LKKHKPWFDKECLGFLKQRKQAKDPSQRSVVILNNVKLADISGTKIRNILELNLRNLKLTVRTKILWTCIEAPVSLRRVTGPELI
jgi:hypothetical protein